MPMRLSCEDSKPLILLVKQRPCLYDPKHRDYNNREAKLDTWDEVSRSLLGDATWNALSDSERETTRHDVKVRWKSLKDAYIRSLRTRGHCDRNHRPYLYERHIKFLKDIHFGGKDTEEDEVVEDHYAYREDLDAEFEDDNVYSILQVGVEQEESSMSFNEVSEVPSKRRTARGPPEANEYDGHTWNKRMRLKVEEPSLSLLQEGSAPVEPDTNCGPSYIDEDKFFLLSLVPQLKEMSQVEKIDFKISVMQLLKENVINRNNNSSDSPS